MNWPALARAVIAGRVALGHDTQKAFAEASRISLRIVSDLEAGKRTSYSASTLARLEQALSWPEGRVEEILAQSEPPPVDFMFVSRDGQAVALELKRVPQADPGSPESDPSWLSTPEGIARHIHRDDLPLVALLHRAGLTESDLFRLILHVRAVRERQNADLLADLATRIRDLGGHSPDVPYPPTWLIALDGLDEANEAAQKSIKDGQKSN